MKKIIYLTIVLIIGIATNGCTGKSLKIEPLDTKVHQIDEICIEENTKVFDKNLLPVMIGAFKKHHINTKVYTDAPNSCDYKLEYTAKSNWDMSMYLQSASIQLYDSDSTVIASVLYKSPDALNLSKYNSTEEKIYPVIDELLKGHVPPTKEQIQARKKKRQPEQNSFESKLDRIKKLHGKGLITDQEYAKKRQSLIDNL